MGQEDPKSSDWAKLANMPSFLGYFFQNLERIKPRNGDCL